MFRLEAGDLVRVAGTDYEMVVIGCADEDLRLDWFDASWFCVWEAEHFLFEEVFAGRDLILVRKERRRIPRGGDINFPVRQENSARVG